LLSRSILLALLCSLFTGCGWVGAGIYLSQASDGSKSSRTNTPPAVTADVPGGVQQGLVLVDYVLTDAHSDRCELELEYSTDGGTTFLLASIRLDSTSPPQLGTAQGLAASPQGTSAFLVWDSDADLGTTPAFRGSVLLRVTPTDALGAVGLTTTTASFDVRGNNPPLAVVTSDLSSGPQKGLIGIDFVLTDDSADPCQVVVQYSTDSGATWSLATAASGTAGLPSSPGGTANLVTWNSSADLAGVDTIASVVLVRLTVSDTATGNTAQIAVAFRVDNLVPSILSYSYYDDDQAGGIDRVDVAFSETVSIASLLAGTPNGFRTVDGKFATSFTTASGGDDTVVQVSFASGNGIPGTAPVDLVYDAAGGITDLAGESIPSTPAGTVRLEDQALPRLVAASAVERFPFADGIDTDDVVAFEFTEAMVTSVITAADVGLLITLNNGNVWTDGNGGLGTATWLSAKRLEIKLSTNGGPPTVAVGDLATPSGLMDLSGKTVIVGKTLDGRDLLICDTGNHVIRRVDRTTRVITTIAGTPTAAGFSGDGGAATAAQLNTPTGIALDPAGNLLVADSGNHRVRLIDASTGEISTIAGNGIPSFGGDSGPAPIGSFNVPAALAVNEAGWVFVADQQNHRVRRLSVP
jgi:hypothetical protein